MIAWSKFFKSYIKLCDYKTDTNWSFWLCDETGRTKNRYPRKASSNYKKFEWSDAGDKGRK